MGVVLRAGCSLQGGSLYKEQPEVGGGGGGLEFNIEVYSAWKREMLPRLVSVNLLLFLNYLRT